MSINRLLYDYESNSLNAIIKDNVPNIDELEQQWAEFNSMVRKKRKDSDRVSLELTGKTNQQRYEDQAKTLSEADVENHGSIYDKTLIDNAKQWIIDNNIHMIYPSPDIDDLYAKFMDQPNRIKCKANTKCIDLFGCNNQELYNLIKGGANTLTNINDYTSYQLTDKMIKISLDDDEDYNKYVFNKINDKLESNSSYINRTSWDYIHTPYLTPYEVRALSEFYSDATNDSVNAIFEEYSKAYYGLSNNFNPVLWDDTVRKLFYLKENAQTVELENQFKQYIVDIGWNPEIKYNIENALRAKSRIQACINEQYKNIEVIDMCGGINESSDNDDIIYELSITDYKPVHIILVKGNSLLSGIITVVDKGPFSHAAICIDNDFKKLYSFNLNAPNKSVAYGGGLSLESIDWYPKDNVLGIYTFFVSNEQYEKLNNNLQKMLDNVNNTKYSIINLVTVLFGNININMDSKMICSQFVDRMLKLSGIDISNKSSDKVTPNTLYHSSISNSKIYKIYEGAVKDFDSKKAAKFVNKLSRKAKSITEFAISSLGLNKWIAKYEYPVLTEAKPILRFNDDGDAILTKPIRLINFDDEYAASHELLMQYEKTNNYEGIKHELCKLFYMNYILQKRINGINPKQKDINTRARVLNDFNKYMNIVLKNQPKFNFSEYYEDSPYYPHTMEIDSNTILYSADIIKRILA